LPSHVFGFGWLHLQSEASIQHPLLPRLLVLVGVDPQALGVPVTELQPLKLQVSHSHSMLWTLLEPWIYPTEHLPTARHLD
jgi:hypothetical protein